MRPLASQPTHGGRDRTGLLLGFLLQSAIGPGVGTSGARSWFHVSSSCKRKMLRVVSAKYPLRSNSHGQQARSCGSDKAPSSLCLSLGSGPREGKLGSNSWGSAPQLGRGFVGTLPVHLEPCSVGLNFISQCSEKANSLRILWDWRRKTEASRCRPLLLPGGRRVWEGGSKSDLGMKVFNKIFEIK